MSYIICDKHGGGIASLVSPEIKKLIVNRKNISKEKYTIKFEDEKGDIYKFYVDKHFFDKIENDYGLDLKENIKSEEFFFEISLELEPVCNKCLSVLI